MNMQRTSGLGWIRGLRRAASRAPKAASGPAEIGLESATSGCVPASAERVRSRSLTPAPVDASDRSACANGTRRLSDRRPTRGVRTLHRPREKGRGVLLLTVAGLLVMPALAHADLLTATITNQEQTVLEGAPATFTVSLAGGTGSQAPVTVKYTVSGEVTPAKDYGAPTGQLTTDCDSTTCHWTLTIPMETTTGNIVIPIVRDQDDQNDDVDLLEGGETLTLTLTEVSTDAGVVRLGTPSEATTTVRDYGSTVTVSVNVDDPDTNTRDIVEPVPEGNAATFTVSLSGLVSQDLVVDYATANGTATAVDYRAQAGTLTIPAEQQEGTITVDTLDDTVAETSETFTVTLMLSDQPDNVVLGKAAATAMIGDNDQLEVGILGPRYVAEGSAATYTVRLTSGTGSEDIVVDYTVRGTATRVEDYKVPNGATTTDQGGFDRSVTIPRVRRQGRSRFRRSLMLRRTMRR